MTTNAIEIAAEARSYSDWIRAMEGIRRGYQRGELNCIDLGMSFKAWGEWVSKTGQRTNWSGTAVKRPDGPMPIDLRAYIVAREFDPTRMSRADRTKKSHTFPKVIAELVAHQDQLHPYARRYLLERLRKGEAGHAAAAKAYGDVANQFETTKAKPQKDVSPPEVA